MRLKRYCRRIRSARQDASDDELNLVPMLDMFLSLIPFLLVSAAFLNYGGILVETPTFASKENPASLPEKADDAVNLAIQVSDLNVTIVGYNRGFLSKVEKIKGDFLIQDRTVLEHYLSELKSQYKIASILFHAESKVRYQNAIQVLNSLKKAALSEHIVLAVRNVPGVAQLETSLAKDKEL